MLEEQIAKLLRDIDPKVMSVISRVLAAEQAKLHQKNPRGINEDIRQIIEEEVRQA